MATFVLVHGSFHGGWCWERVAIRLRAAGHTVDTPTLTGLGERSHLVHPRVGLDLHVRDVVQALEYDDRREVVLVGHSYGGMVITGVAEHCADRVAHVVYLDGFRPEHGQSAWDISPDAKERWEEAADEAGNGWLVPPPDPKEAYGMSGSDAEWVRENLVSTPLLTHEQPVRAPDARATDVPQTYVACSQYEGFESEARRARNEEIEYHELDAGHDAMVTAPEEVTAILLDLAVVDA